MKKIIFLAIVLMISFNVRSQTTDYREYVAYLKQNGYSISAELYADLKQGASATHTKYFSSGLHYIIVACSDDGEVRDLDIYVYDNDGNVYVKDTKASSFAVVDMTLMFSRNMEVAIKNYSSNYPNYSSRCRFFIAYK
jgi:hypothetical protein